MIQAVPTFTATAAPAEGPAPPRTTFDFAPNPAFDAYQVRLATMSPTDRIIHDIECAIASYDENLIDAESAIECVGLHMEALLTLRDEINARPGAAWRRLWWALRAAF